MRPVPLTSLVRPDHSRSQERAKALMAYSDAGYRGTSCSRSTSGARARTTCAAAAASSLSPRML